MVKKKTNKKQGSKEENLITTAKDFLPVEEKVEKKEYGYVVNMSHSPYNHSEAGYNILPGVVTKVKAKDIVWLRGIIGLKEVELGKGVKVD